MKLFSFANLGIRGARAEGDGYDEDDERAKDEDERATEDDDQRDDDAAEADDEDDAAMDDVDEESGDDAEDDADDGDEDGEDEDGDGEQSAAFKRGAAAARKRIGAILSGPNVGAHNFAQAADIACNMPQLSAKEASRLLGAGPAAKTGGGLAAAMRGRQPKSPARGDRGGAKTPSTADRMRSRFKKEG